MANIDLVRRVIEEHGVQQDRDALCVFKSDGVEVTAQRVETRYSYVYSVFLGDRKVYNCSSVGKPLPEVLMTELEIIEWKKPVEEFLGLTDEEKIKRIITGRAMDVFLQDGTMVR